MNSTNLSRPFFGPQSPLYPQLLQLVRVTSATPVPSSSSSSGVLPAGQSVYYGITQQQRDATIATRDRESCFVYEPNGNPLTTQIYLCRLEGSLSGLPLYATVVDDSTATTTFGTGYDGSSVNVVTTPPDFVSTHSYVVGDIVSYPSPLAGSHYRCIQDAPPLTNPPDTAPTYWSLLSGSTVVYNNPPPMVQLASGAMYGVPIDLQGSCVYDALVQSVPGFNSIGGVTYPSVSIWAFNLSYGATTITDSTLFIDNYVGYYIGIAPINFIATQTTSSTPTAGYGTAWSFFVGDQPASIADIPNFALFTTYLLGDLAVDTGNSKAYVCKLAYITNGGSSQPSADATHWTLIGPSVTPSGGWVAGTYHAGDMVTVTRKVYGIRTGIGMIQFVASSTGFTNYVSTQQAVFTAGTGIAIAGASISGPNSGGLYAASYQILISVDMASLTITISQISDYPTPVADGTYTIGAKLTPVTGTNGSITVSKGIITAITPAT